MISIVVPVYNEEEALEELYRQLMIVFKKLDEPYEFVFANNGSEDRSLEILLKLMKRDRNVRVVDLSRNFGQQMSITAGLDHAKGDAVIVMDADLQDPPSLIPQMIEKWREGNEVVYGIRKKRKGVNFIRDFSYKIYYLIIKNLTDVPIPLNAGDFRLLSRKTVDTIKSFPEKRRYLRGLSSWIGFKQTGIEYERPTRFAGETKFSWRGLINFAWEGVTSLSLKPLKIATYMGIFVSGFSLIYIVRIVLCSFIYR